MPGLPRVSGRETIRALERLGFVVKRQRGSHVVLRRGSVGVSVEEFLAASKRGSLVPSIGRQRLWRFRAAGTPAARASGAG